MAFGKILTASARAPTLRTMRTTFPYGFSGFLLVTCLTNLEMQHPLAPELNIEMDDGNVWSGFGTASFIGTFKQAGGTTLPYCVVPLDA